MIPEDAAEDPSPCFKIYHEGLSCLSVTAEALGGSEFKLSSSKYPKIYMYVRF